MRSSFGKHLAVMIGVVALIFCGAPVRSTAGEHGGKKSAAKEIESIPRKADRLRIVRKIQSLADQPRPAGCRKLAGSEKYRLRQGSYRIVYSIEDSQLVNEQLVKRDNLYDFQKKKNDDLNPLPKKTGAGRILNRSNTKNYGKNSLSVPIFENSHYVG